jgi:hypothetical protein
MDAECTRTPAANGHENPLEWFRDFFAGRTADEINHIKTFAEAAFPAGAEPTLEAVEDSSPGEDMYEDARKRFETAYSDLLHARAVESDPNAPQGAMDQAMNVESDALRRLIAEPAFVDYQLLQKFEALDVYMQGIDEGWFDQRVSRLLGSIKADITNFRMERR